MGSLILRETARDEPVAGGNGNLFFAQVSKFRLLRMCGRQPGECPAGFSTEVGLWEVIAIAPG